MSLRQQEKPMTIVAAALTLLTVVAAALALLIIVLSVLATIGASQVYVNDNFADCPAGEARLGELYPLAIMYLVALLAMLVALPVALYKAIAKHHRAWVVALIVATVLGVLITVAYQSSVSQAAVGASLGFGCSITYSSVTVVFAPLVVAVPILASLMIDLVADVRRGR